MIETEPYTTFTSESVCRGHPDKLCDRISDAILDAALEADRGSRVAIETLATRNQVVIAGELTTSAKLDLAGIAGRNIALLGYTDSSSNFHNSSPISIFVHQQSREIAVGVDNEGAGDQGMMFGFACRETPELMPLPIVLAHALVKRIDEARETGQISYLFPDGKSQVTVRYQNGAPIAIGQVVIAVPHQPLVELDQVRQDVYSKVVMPVLDQLVRCSQ